MALIDGLVSYWKLDESSGDAIDSVGSNDGTVFNATRPSSGKIATSYYSTSDNVVRIGTPADLNTTSVSVSFWFKADASSAFQIPLGKYGNSQVGWTTKYRIGGACHFQIGSNGGANDTAASANTFSAGSFHHFVGTYDGTNLRVFVDGVYEGTNTSAQTLSNSSINLQFYGDASGIGESYDGFLDEVGVWDRDLTFGAVSVGQTAGGEVAELYNSDNGLSYPFSSSIQGINQITGVQSITI